MTQISFLLPSKLPPQRSGACKVHLSSCKSYIRLPHNNHTGIISVTRYFCWKHNNVWKSKIKRQYLSQRLKAKIEASAASPSLS